MLRYDEAFPAELESAIDRGAPAVVAWGALEWHGCHLPLGLDGIVADWFARHLAERLNGVLLPSVWLPMTTLPHRASLQVSTETFRAILDDLLASLAGAGFKQVCLVTGHYAQGHLWELFEAAERASISVLAGTPLQPLEQDELLDHAGRYEASQLAAIRPDLVRLGGLPTDLIVREHAVLGRHPSESNVAEGERLLHEGLEAWVRWSASATKENLSATYARAKEGLGEYREKFYRESWEQAIKDWWATKG
jgi:creatinine amidohydrolase